MLPQNCADLNWTIRFDVRRNASLALPLSARGLDHRIVSAVVNQSAKVPAYLLELDVGEPLLATHRSTISQPSSASKKKSPGPPPSQFYISSAQLTSQHPDPSRLVSLHICTVVNFPSKQIGKVRSHALVTGVQVPNGDYETKRLSTVVVTPEWISGAGEVVSGLRIGIAGLGDDGEVVGNVERDLAWDEFAQVELEMGTVVEVEATVESGEEHKTVRVGVDFGNEQASRRRAIIRVHKDVNVSALLGRMSLAWTNPGYADVTEENPDDGKVVPFEDNEKLRCLATESGVPVDESPPVLLTTNNGRMVIVGSLPVQNGYTLA
ncbi:hypothetical protein BJ742DRAFT_817238 [Cladochytrium replicatum]|nr:hypothetical protein BJ742DRAFT_817238 [Cladochytrium replicatum]